MNLRFLLFFLFLLSLIPFSFADPFDFADDVILSINPNPDLSEEHVRDNPFLWTIGIFALIMAIFYAASGKLPLFADYHKGRVVLGVVFGVIAVVLPGPLAISASWIWLLIVLAILLLFLMLPFHLFKGFSGISGDHVSNWLGGGNTQEPNGWERPRRGRNPRNPGYERPNRRRNPRNGRNQRRTNQNRQLPPGNQDNAQSIDINRELTELENLTNHLQTREGIEERTRARLQEVLNEPGSHLARAYIQRFQHLEQEFEEERNWLQYHFDLGIDVLARLNHVVEEAQNQGQFVPEDQINRLNQVGHQLHTLYSHFQNTNL